MFTYNHSVGYITHRAVVRVTNASTGICQVEIPELTGAGVLTYVSNIGLSMVAGLYNVPAVGSTVFVASSPASDRVFFVSEQRNGIADTLSTTLVTSKGGTGASAYVAGDTIYAATTGASAFTRLAKGTANQVVGMNAAATAPEYKTVAGTTDQVVVTHAANSVTLSTPQSINTTSAPTFASATLNTAAGAKVTMSGTTSNWLEWNNAGLGAPSTTTRSVGTKAVLYPSLDASNADYAVGINSGTLWSSAPTGASFKWFSNATSIASLAPTGALTASSFVGSGASITDLPASVLTGTSLPVGITGSSLTALGTVAALTATNATFTALRLTTASVTNASMSSASITNASIGSAVLTNASIGTKPAYFLTASGSSFVATGASDTTGAFTLTGAAVSLSTVAGDIVNVYCTWDAVTVATNATFVGGLSVVSNGVTITQNQQAVTNLVLAGLRTAVSQHYVFTANSGTTTVSQVFKSNSALAVYYNATHTGFTYTVHSRS